MIVRSFTLAANNTVSICYSKEVTEIECTLIAGIDRNLGNVTCGNDEKVITFDTSKAVQITENTRSVMRSFKRNDVRIRKKMAGRYGPRRKNRVNQLLHKVSKTIVQQAKSSRKQLSFLKILLSFASYTSAGITKAATIAER
jgi:putative transposase